MTLEKQTFAAKQYDKLFNFSLEWGILQRIVGREVTSPKEFKNTGLNSFDDCHYV